MTVILSAASRRFPLGAFDGMNARAGMSSHDRAGSECPEGSSGKAQ